MYINVSTPRNDPNGELPASLRDTVAAAYAAAAMVQQSTGTHFTSQQVRNAYYLADKFLAERVKLEQGGLTR